MARELVQILSTQSKKRDIIRESGLTTNQFDRKLLNKSLNKPKITAKIQASSIETQREASSEQQKYTKHEVV